MGLVRRLLGRAAPSPVVEPSADHATVELRGGGTRVVLVPALGGRIIEMELAGRQWLVRGTPPVPGDAASAEGASYTAIAGASGYDDAFPTLAPCTLPTWIARFGGASLPDHGELWSARPAFALEADTSGARAVTRWTGARMPWVFTRTVGVDGTGEMSVGYTLENAGADPIPFVWSAHPVFPLGPATRIVLPNGSRVRVWRSQGIDLGGERREHRWPRVRVGDRLVDMSVPAAVERAFTCKLFVDVPEGWAVLEEAGARLEVRYDPRVSPQIGLALDRGGSAHRGRIVSQYVSLQPCVGAPDSLSEALGAWNAAHWVRPGETRRWNLAWRGERVLNLNS